MVTAKTKINIIIGDPVEHSISPQLHNLAYQHHKLDKDFIYLACRVKKTQLKQAIAGAKALGINGITCTIPHKVNVIKYLDKIDKTAKQIGAVNTILNKNGKLIGYNTDWYGIEAPLKKRITLKDKTAAVLGAGGAARAVCYALAKNKIKITVFNRTLEKAKQLASDFKAEYKSINEKHLLKSYDIVINATPVGMYPNIKDSLLTPKDIAKDQIIFDIVYTPYETQLLKNAKKAGAKIIYGFEMLLYQAILQFKIYTNQTPDEDFLRTQLYKLLKIK